MLFSEMNHDFFEHRWKRVLMRILKLFSFLFLQCKRLPSVSWEIAIMMGESNGHLCQILCFEYGLTPKPLSQFQVSHFSLLVPSKLCFPSFHISLKKKPFPQISEVLLNKWWSWPKRRKNGKKLTEIVYTDFCSF